MEQLFKSVLLLSCVGGGLSALLLLLRPLAKRFFTPQWQYIIYLCALLVLLLPVRFDRPASAAAASPALSATMQTAQASPDTLTPGTPAVQAPPIGVPAAAPRLPRLLPPLLAYVWLLGVIGWACSALFSYLRFLWLLRKNASSVPCPEAGLVSSELGLRRKIRVRIAPCVAAPMMVGLFRPTLLLPERPMEEEALRHVLLHELTHVKHGDLFFKWFALAVRCIHWFNPLVHLLCRELNEVCEISCDLSVTRAMDAGEKRGYMGTILTLSAPVHKSSPSLATSMAAGRAQMERRFTMIQTAKRPTRLRCALSVVLAFVLLSASLLASGAAAGESGLYNGEASAIAVYNGDVKLSFVHQPFVENYEIYLPLRETLNQFGITDIRWDNGRIDIALPLIEPYQGAIPQESSCWFTLGSNRIQVPSDEEKISYRNGVPDPDAEKGYPLRYSPIVRDGVTYATVEFFEFLIFVGQIPHFHVRYLQSANPKDYCADGEEVFIGTAEEQKRFNPVDENGNPRYVKRIVTSEKGEAVYVVTAENQRPEVISALKPLNSAGAVSFSTVISRTFFINAYGEYYVLSSGIFVSEQVSANDFNLIAYIPPALQINYHAYWDYEIPSK